MNRTLNIVSAFTILLLLSPLMLVIYLAIVCQIGRPVFFRQQRPGMHGKIFRINKFRTMSNDRDQHGELLPDSQRLNGFGRFLRSTSLDELPALINVLKGQMSLVGPRPLYVHYLNLYSPEQARRHDVRPGITGWSQVNGRNNLDWPERLAMDVWYVDNQSLMLDLKILMLTLVKVAKREGITPDGKDEMHQFVGNDGSAAS